jgi:hypothetical protein
MRWQLVSMRWQLVSMRLSGLPQYALHVCYDVSMRYAADRILSRTRKYAAIWLLLSPLLCLMPYALCLMSHSIPFGCCSLQYAMRSVCG